MSRRCWEGLNRWWKGLENMKYAFENVWSWVWVAIKIYKFRYNTVFLEIKYEMIFTTLCHTLFFDLRAYFHTLFWPVIFVDFSRKISAESYFKITHFCFVSGLLLYLIFIWFDFSFFLIFLFLFYFIIRSVLFSLFYYYLIFIFILFSSFLFYFV